MYHNSTYVLLVFYKIISITYFINILLKYLQINHNKKQIIALDYAWNISRLENGVHLIITFSIIFNIIQLLTSTTVKNFFTIFDPLWNVNILRNHRIKIK